MGLHATEVAEALAALETSAQELQSCVHTTDPRAALAAIQNRVKKAYRRLALELHADQTHGDVVKEARLARILLVAKDVAALRIEGDFSPPPAGVSKSAAGVSLALFRRKRAR